MVRKFQTVPSRKLSRCSTPTATVSPTRRNSSPLRLSLRAPAGTDPRDPRSVLRLSPRDKSATGLTLQFPTQPGKTYRIEYTEDLTTSQWHPLTDPISGDGQPIQVLDPAATTRPQRFYRLIVLPP